MFVDSTILPERQYNTKCSVILRITFVQKFYLVLGVKLRLSRGETRHVNIGKRIDKNALLHQLYINCAANILLRKLSMALEPSK